ncbi:ARHGJ factor, partial [Polypterus senegalus]
MRVYSPESLSDESLSSPSLECEYLFPTSAFEDELKGIPPPLPSSRGPTESAVSPPADPSDCFEDMVVAEAAGQAARPGDQERRRFSASELISRLQLSQRKSSFTLKLGKSLSARVTPKEKGGSRSLSPEGKSRHAQFRFLMEMVLAGNGVKDFLAQAKFELVTSEASYIRSLSIAVDHFMCSRELSDCLGTQERQWLFSKLPDVKDVSERFLSDLEERLEEDILRFDVSDIVLTHCPAFRKVYLPYVTNQAYQEQTYQRLLLENPRFPVILARLEEDPVCQRLPLTSFLILPFQRITRLKMLVENILKRTAPGSKDEDTATKAFNELKKLIKECNSSVQSMKRTEELIHLNKKIHFEGKIFPLISQSRWLVKHGELLEVDTQTISMSGSKLKLPTRPVYLHLFNDYLLLSRKKETGKFAVFVHAKIGGLKVKDLNVKLHGISGYIFHLQICDGQQLKYQILLKALTESEKQRWITAMFPSNLEAGKEHIKENEDLPQVQCIRSYKAQEDDELTLEKADILQAKTITNDGWIEGIRLSDGERGWFPKSYVEEITSRSARLRNLRENNRIKCATQKLEEEYL